MNTFPRLSAPSAHQFRRLGSTFALGVALLALPGFAPSAMAQDTDGDTLSDTDETSLYLTDPLNVDTDGDGLFDDWEILGVPWINNMGVGQRYVLPYNNGQPWKGARRKTLYVESDVMPGINPFAQVGINLAAITFGSAPVANPDGSQGIDLVSVNEDVLWATSFSYDPANGIGWPPEYAGFKQNWFGTLTERANPNWWGPAGSSGPMRNAKLKAYRYVVFGNRLGSTTVGGIAELRGNDMIVTLGGWWWGTPPLSAAQLQYRQQVFASTFMHELGHNLALFHGGWDSDVNFKPNHHSVMNYTWTYPRYVGYSLVPTPRQLAYGASWSLDYSSVLAGPIDENLLSEANTTLCLGCGAAHASHVVPIGPVGPWGWGWLEAETVPGIDFNRDGVIGAGLTTADLNYVTASYCSPPQCDDPVYVCPHLDWCPHTGSDDWSNLQYPLSGSPNYASGAHGIVLPQGPEIDLEVVQMLSYAGACQHEDGFEAYEELAEMDERGGWRGWDGNPLAVGMIATAPVRTGERALDISLGADQVHEYCSTDGQQWSFSAWQFISASFSNNAVGQFAGSYFILLNRYEPGAAHAESDWSVQMQFDGASNLVKVFYGAGLDTIDVPMKREQWVRIKAIIDLDDDWTRIYYDDVLVVEYPWTGGVLGGGRGAAQVAAVDLFANGSAPVYYDDVRFELVGVAPPCGLGDINCDGFVDAADLALLLGAWFTNNEAADLDDNGIVDAGDLALLLGAWSV